MTTTPRLYPGSRIDIDMTVKLKDGTLVNPTALTLTVKAPNGTETIYSYPSGTFVNTATGKYSLTIAIPRVHSSEGLWRYVPVATGYSIKTVERQFSVDPSQFDIAP